MPVDKMKRRKSLTLIAVMLILSFPLLNAAVAMIGDAPYNARDPLIRAFGYFVMYFPYISSAALAAGWGHYAATRRTRALDLLLIVPYVAFVAIALTFSTYLATNWT